MLASVTRAATNGFVARTPGNPLTWEATLGRSTFRGQATGINAVLAGNPLDVVNRPTCTCTIDMATLGTGNPSNDAILRGRTYLDVARYPTATFALERVVSAVPQRLAEGVPVEVKAQAMLTLHGVTRTVPVQASLTMQGGTLRMACAFDIDVTQFGITQPHVLCFKMGKVIHLRVGLTARRDA
ncbi:MAG TPA: YceI family protein [Candidatus Xenobia bacterium]|jgi:polyisoprenoid-binding protein YceI